MVEWETGEVKTEPLFIIAADNPVTCAIYGKANDLLELDGWSRSKKIAKRHKKLFCMANQAKLRSFGLSLRYKYGFKIPRSFKHDKEINIRNRNTKWHDSTKLQMQHLNGYDNVNNLGNGDKGPTGYKKIRVHLKFDVEHDGRLKFRCLADGHLTDIHIYSVYSGVVSLRGLGTMLFFC